MAMARLTVLILVISFSLSGESFRCCGGKQNGGGTKESNPIEVGNYNYNDYSVSGEYEIYNGEGNKQTNNDFDCDYETGGGEFGFYTRRKSRSGFRRFRRKNKGKNKKGWKDNKKGWKDNKNDWNDNKNDWKEEVEDYPANFGKDVNPKRIYTKIISNNPCKPKINQDTRPNNSTSIDKVGESGRKTFSENDTTDDSGVTEYYKYTGDSTESVSSVTDSYTENGNHDTTGNYSKVNKYEVTTNQDKTDSQDVTGNYNKSDNYQIIINHGNIDIHNNINKTTVIINNGKTDSQGGISDQEAIIKKVVDKVNKYLSEIDNQVTINQVKTDSQVTTDEAIIEKVADRVTKYLAEIGYQDVTSNYSKIDKHQVSINQDKTNSQVVTDEVNKISNQDYIIEKVVDKVTKYFSEIGNKDITRNYSITINQDKTGSQVTTDEVTMNHDEISNQEAIIEKVADKVTKYLAEIGYQDVTSNYIKVDIHHVTINQGKANNKDITGEVNKHEVTMNHDEISNQEAIIEKLADRVAKYLAENNTDSQVITDKVNKHEITMNHDEISNQEDIIKKLADRVAKYLAEIGHQDVTGNYSNVNKHEVNINNDEITLNNNYNITVNHDENCNCENTTNHAITNSSTEEIHRADAIINLQIGEGLGEFSRNDGSIGSENGITSDKSINAGDGNTGN